VLRHAAGDAEDEAGVVLAVAQELAGAPVDALLGLLADGAGVEEDDVGGGGVVDAGVAAGRSWPTMRAESASFIWQPRVSR
jgi:hypothetical protein